MSRLTIGKPPTLISNDQITLRRYEPDDAEFLYAAARESSTEVYPFLEWCHPDYQLEESHNWIALIYRKWLQGEGFDFAVLDNKTQTYLGGCGLNDIRLPQYTANLGYWIRSSATGHGIATESSRLLAKFAFNHLALRRLEIVIAENNCASIRVAEKIGAILEGILRNKLFLQGTSTDALLYSLIPSDVQ
ncbi:MAG: GNAT family protein [Gammaproteobacteria bacterium]|nr:GNAT family protein [Gammaproteobacteria bacterium]